MEIVSHINEKWHYALDITDESDAGYDSRKGQVYQVQIMETYHDEQDDRKPDLITHVDVKPAHKHDANALQPAQTLSGETRQESCLYIL